MSVCVSVSVCVWCTQVCECVCECVCMCVHTCVMCTCVCMYMHVACGVRSGGEITVYKVNVYIPNTGMKTLNTGTITV